MLPNICLNTVANMHLNMLKTVFTTDVSAPVWTRLFTCVALHPRFPWSQQRALYTCEWPDEGEVCWQDCRLERREGQGIRRVGSQIVNSLEPAWSGRDNGAQVRLLPLQLSDHAGEAFRPLFPE